MAGKYAQSTDVPVAKSQFEIKALVSKYGADSFQLGETRDKAAIMFDMNGRRLRFFLPLPDRADKSISHFRHSSGRIVPRQPQAVEKKWEQACRSRWRALLLCIRAKLEAVECGITEFDDEFMAHIVMPDGQTVGQHLRPRIATAYETGNMPPLLPRYN